MNDQPNNPPAFPSKCKWCDEPPYKKQGRIYLCVKHYRFQSMRTRAKTEGKIVPSYDHLESMLITFGMKCQGCSKKLNWLQKEGSKSVMCLQHDDSGDLKFFCPGCNVLHGKSSRDRIYEIKPGQKFCKSCDQIKSVDSFYIDKHTVNGRKSSCKECSNKKMNEWRKQNTRMYNDYQIKYRAERSKHVK